MLVLRSTLDRALHAQQARLTALEVDNAFLVKENEKLSALNDALRDLLVSMRPAVAIEGDITPPKTVQQADADFVAMTKENKKR